MLLRCAAAVACLCCLPALVAAQERPLRIGNVTAQFGAPRAGLRARSPTISRPFSTAAASRWCRSRASSRWSRRWTRDELDFVIASPVALVTLTTRHRVRPIATVTQSAGDRLSPWLAGAVFVRSDRQDLQRLEDARGQRVLALSRLALGGWLAPMREWRRRGLDEADFASLRVRLLVPARGGQGVRGRRRHRRAAGQPAGRPAGRRARAASACWAARRVATRRYPIAVSTPLYPEAAFRRGERPRTRTWSPASPWRSSPSTPAAPPPASSASRASRRLSATRRCSS